MEDLLGEIFTAVVGAPFFALGCLSREASVDGVTSMVQDPNCRGAFFGGIGWAIGYVIFRWGFEIVLAPVIILGNLPKLFKRTPRLPKPSYIHPARDMVLDAQRQASKSFAAYMAQMEVQDDRLTHLFQGMSTEDQATWQAKYEARMRQARAMANLANAQAAAKQAEIELANAIYGRDRVNRQ